MAVQIVDEPAACGMTIHPLDKADQFTVSKMVGKKRAYDEIGAPRRIQREDVCCLEANRGVFWRDLLSRLFGPRVKVNPDQHKIKVPFPRPPPDSPQHISAAAANINDRYRLFGTDTNRHALKPSQRWAVGQCKGIDNSQRMQTVMELREANRFGIHQLRTGAALAEIFHQFPAV